MTSDPVRIETRATAADDWRCLVGMRDDIGALDAYEAACRWIAEECSVRLVVRGVVRAEREPARYDGMGVA